MNRDPVFAALGQWLMAGFAPGGLRVLGLSGAQGVGKSTMARRLITQAWQSGLRAGLLALDDYYLTKAERADLARAIHPLLAVRGPPGTHDIAWLARDIAALRGGEPVRVPRFDKSRDDRAARFDWPLLRGPLDVLLLEGWCVGARPQPARQLVAPINDLEAREDAAGIWRGWINAQLAGPYEGLFGTLDGLAFLAAPDFCAVQAWRWQQEQALPPGPAVMEAWQIARFTQHFERITQWMLGDLPGRTDLTLHLDGARQLVSIQQNAPR